MADELTSQVVRSVARMGEAERQLSDLMTNGQSTRLIIRLLEKHGEVERVKGCDRTPWWLYPGAEDGASPAGKNRTWPEASP